MDKKYSSGNYLINNKFGVFSYELNPSTTNNRLIYKTSLFPFSKTRYINNSIVFVNYSIDSYKFNIYYSFTLNNNIYKIYDCYGDYEDAQFNHENVNEGYIAYKSNSFMLYVYSNNSQLNYKLVNIKTNTEYYFLNSNYPYQINYYDGRQINITITNNKINSITCNEEEIYFMYQGSTVDVSLYKIINNIDVPVASTTIYLNNTNNLKLYYYLYQYDDLEENYVDIEVDKYDISYSSSILTITNSVDNTNIKYYYTNDKITKIELDTGNVLETNISYNSNLTTITEYESTLKLFYDNNNMISYLIKNDKYIKFYKYNDNFLLEYESDFVKNENIINDNLLDYDIETFEPEDEYDETDYSFSINQDYNQTIPTNLTLFIDSNDIFHLDGYAKLTYDHPLYGEEDDDMSILLFTKISSGYIYIDIRYFGGDYSHTSRTKRIDVNNDFSPFVIGLKPGYSYDKVRIEIFINGEAYINTPKLTKTHMGTYYLYNANNMISSLDNKDGWTDFSYSNNLVTSVITPTMTRTFTRDNHGNVTLESVDGYNIIRTYDNKNRQLTESSNDSSISYQYSETCSSDNYDYLVNIQKNLINYYIHYDSCGREKKSIESYTINNSQINDTIINSYDGAKLIDVYNNSDHMIFSYNNYDKLTAANDLIDTTYNFTWQNNKITDVKYNQNRYISKKTYDNRDRLSTLEFNGIYSYTYSSNPKKIQVHYNNTLKGEFNFNNYDLLISDGYNNYEYDSNDQIKKNTISDYEFNYYKDNVGYNDTTSTLFNYTYNNYKYGDAKLRTDSYYSNVTFNDDSSIRTINSSNTTIMKYEDEFYPLTSNLLSINGDSPKSFTKQDYRLFYYDKDINNYATLLYGTKIRYNTNVLFTGQIEFEFKLETRHLDQVIIYFKSYLRNIYIYRKSNRYLVIRNEWEDVTYTTSYRLTNVWYKMRIEFNNSTISIKFKPISESDYYTYTISYNPNQNADNFIIQFGKIEYYYNQMTTFGLIRNLFVSTSLSTDRDYINIYKSNSLLSNNEIKKSEIRINNGVILDTTRTITQNVYSAPHNNSSSRYEKRSLSMNNGSYIMESYLYRDICYENYIKLNNQMYYSYEYDGKLRLTKEKVYSNQSLQSQIVYTYDTSENILSWTRFYGFYPKIVSFNYNNQYKTILDSISIRENNITTNYTITYDNTTGMLPISFMGNTYSYEGTRLISYNNYNYVYDLYGKRIRKYNNSINIWYYYDKNNNLLLEDRGTYRIKYLYDSSNNLYGFIYDSTNNNSFEINEYFYLKDETGTIWGITNSSGNLIGTYTYNAYGLILSVNTISDSLGVTNKNPFRYKTYYYDTESEMYYLNSRYYNPLLCRFITPDNFDNVDIKEKKTYNLYSYCFNNPTSYTDSNGTNPWKAIWTGVIRGTQIFVAIAKPNVLPIVGAIEFCHDILKISKTQIKDTSKGVEIVNSFEIHTPMAQFFYSLFVNSRINKTTGKMSGTAFSTVSEWMCHNVLYFFGYKTLETGSVNLGPTIFDDTEHNGASILMKELYKVLLFPISLIDYIIYLINKNEEDD
ncbi:MAG: RHS repeat-associated core domain-containing protein [Acholeplasmatales bacterium]|nr:RHS repeat-associated core domain-containing protein [Acholeplasmatales bacterium]